jgi:hypothetical protein
VYTFRVPEVFQWIDSLDLTDELHQRFPVQEAHILSIGGDALNMFMIQRVLQKGLIKENDLLLIGMWWHSNGLLLMLSNFFLMFMSGDKEVINSLCWWM